MYSLDFRLPARHPLALGLGTGEALFHDHTGISTSVFTRNIGRQAVSRHWEAALDTENGTFAIIEKNRPHLSWGKVLEKTGLGALFGVRSGNPVPATETVRESVSFEMAVEMLKSLEAKARGENLEVEQDATALPTHWCFAESLLLDNEPVAKITPVYKRPQPAELQPGPAAP